MTDMERQQMEKVVEGVISSRFNKMYKSIISIGAAILLFMVAQGGAAIWWASRTTAIQDNMVNNIAEIKKDAKDNTKNQYTVDLAASDRMMMSKIFELHLSRIERNEKDIAALRNKIGRP